MSDRSDPPTQVEITDELHACEACGYAQGFHVSFKRATPENLRIILICPNCGARYDAGWTA